MIKQTIYDNIPKLTMHASKGASLSKKGNKFPIHYHEDIELLPVFSGTLSCFFENSKVSAHAGEVIFINSLVPHSTEAEEDDTLSGLIQFKKKNFISTDIPEIITYSAAPIPENEKLCTVISDRDFFRAVDEIINESYNQDEAYDMFIRSAIYRIIGHLYRSKALSQTDGIHDTREVQKILPVLRYINTNYSEDITLEAAAEMLSFDRSYFCRMFKTAIGATFTEYLNYVRIYKSEKLLSKTDKSILEISEAVGFSSVSYFNRIFKKHKGFSPRFYRTAKFNRKT